MREIESESEFSWREFKFLLRLPWLLFLILIGKRSWSELLQPLKDIGAFLLAPRMTAVLIVANLAVFVFQALFMGDELLRGLVFQPRHLLELDVFPMMASWFLHANLAHLAGNMVALAVFGRIVERSLGGGQLLLIYFGSAVISDLIAAAFGQGGIGASGAIAGLISAGILISPFYLTHFLFGLPLPAMLVGWAMMAADVMGVLVPKDDNIGHIAHLGGYAAIAFLAYLFNRDLRDRMRRGLIINVAFAAFAAGAWLILKARGII
jgi:membrane associated rhomboid family serine protease